MELYSYQKKCIECILSSPSPSQLISMPTGTGKTITFLSAAKSIGKKTLFLVHRQELLNQTIEKALKLGIEKCDISVISSEKKEKVTPYTIAMVQTLLNNLSSYSPDDVEAIIVDEAHHSLAASYLKIFDYFKIFEESKTLLGFTATPLRGDGKNLGAIYKHHSFKMTLEEACKKGYICPVHGVRVQIHYELDKVENRGGDYDISQLDKIFNCETLNELIANKCSHVMRLPAIIFCATINHAENIKNKLLEKNRKAEVISYLNSKSECSQILERLKNNEIEFLLNAVKLTEGFDHPPIQTVIIARPTRSPALYKQMIGRGLRLSPNKYDCLVLEFGSNDPKMITWDAIDTSATFQCFTEGELVTDEEAKRKYESQFPSSKVTVLDVRVSVFSFYECRIQRIVKYRKEFRYIPNDDGFTLFHITPVYLRRNKKELGFGFKMILFQLMWKEKYKSFTCFDRGELWKAKDAWTLDILEDQIKFYAKKAVEGSKGEELPLGRWYPSEEENISPRQKSFLPTLEKTNGRKAEMIIEDAAIKNCIEKFWRKNSFPELDENKEGSVMDDRVFKI